jgi:hypothetical protein
MLSILITRTQILNLIKLTSLKQIEWCLYYIIFFSFVLHKKSFYQKNIFF